MYKYGRMFFVKGDEVAVQLMFFAKKSPRMSFLSELQSFLIKKCSHTFRSTSCRLNARQLQ